MSNRTSLDPDMFPDDEGLTAGEVRVAVDRLIRSHDEVVGVLGELVRSIRVNATHSPNTSMSEFHEHCQLVWPEYFNESRR